MNHEAFINGHGDLWYRRNKGDMGKKDPIQEMLDEVLTAIPGAVLEIGCANGWRLKNLRKKYGCHIYGVDPSAEAVAAANEKNIIVGTAQTLPYADDMFQAVIFGYCLFLIEPKDWFLVAYQGCRVLKDGGLLIIYDRSSPRAIKATYPYEEHNGKKLDMYFFDWVSFFVAHPCVKKLYERVMMYDDQFESVAILQKNLKL